MLADRLLLSRWTALVFDQGANELEFIGPRRWAARGLDGLASTSASTGGRAGAGSRGGDSPMPVIKPTSLPARGRFYATASPRSSNPQVFNACGDPGGIRTRVYSPPRAFVSVLQSWAMLTKRGNGRTGLFGAGPLGLSGRVSMLGLSVPSEMHR
jgi:hypothetical protein